MQIWKNLGEGKNIIKLYLNLKIVLRGVREMTHQLRSLAALPEYLDLSLSIHPVAHSCL